MLKGLASNTLLVGDKHLWLVKLGEWQPDDNEGYTAGWDHDTIRHTDAPNNWQPQPDYAGGESGISDNMIGIFGSSHPGMFQTAFVDGSVHPIAYTIDPKTFMYLGNINDGHVIDSSQF